MIGYDKHSRNVTFRLYLLIILSENTNPFFLLFYSIYIFIQFLFAYFVSLYVVT